MEKLKIAKFGLSLEGQAACWYSQYKLEHFVTFQQLRDKFIRLFHREVTQREIIGQFYATYQEANETVPQFIIRFQNLQKQLTQSPLEDEVKEIFLMALWEPL